MQLARRSTPPSQYRVATLMAVVLAAVAAPSALSGCESDSGGSGGAAAGGLGGQGGEGAGTGGKGTGGQGTGGKEGTGGQGTGGKEGTGGDPGNAGEGGRGTSEGTVRGKVIDETGRALAQAKVLIEGHVVLTSSAGAFEVEDVPEVYDLIVQPQGSDSVTVWQDATRRDPTAVAVMEYQPPGQTVVGSVLGAHPSDAPIPYVLQVGYMCDDGSRQAELQTSAAMSVGILWKDWSNPVCRLMALETGTDGDDKSFAFGSRDLELTADGVDLPGHDVQLEQTSSVTRDYLIEEPPGSTSILTYWGPFGMDAKIESATSQFTHMSVEVPLASIPVFVKTESDGMVAELTLTEDVEIGSISYLDAVRALTPASGAVIPRDQEFVATRPAFGLRKGIYAFSFRDGADHQVHVYTNERRTTTTLTSTGHVQLPDLEPLGAGFKGAIDWNAQFVDSPTSVDVALGAHEAAKLKYTSVTNSASWE